MKLITLAAASLAALFVAQTADAQGVLYTTVPPAGSTVTYYNGPGNTYSGDVIRVTPATATFDRVRAYFVATAAGIYNVTCAGANGYTFPTAIPAAPAPSAINIPAPGVYQVSFVFAPLTPIGPVDQYFTFQSDSPNFTTAYFNQAAVPAGTDVPANMFMIDTNANAILEPGPPVNEAYSFGAGNWNLIMHVSTDPLLASTSLLSTCKQGDVEVERVDDVTAVPASRLVSSRINTNL